MWVKEWGAGLFFLLIIFALVDISGSFVGVNINTDSSGLPSASDITSILRSRGIRHVRLLGHDHQLLAALANTGIEVMVEVPNDRLLRVGLSRAAAAAWVTDNVAAFRPATNITHIAVGREVLTAIPNAALVLLPAIKFLQSALVAANLTQEVKVSTPHSMGVISSFFPPSAAAFNSTWGSVMSGLLQFLKNTSSSFMLNASPYNGYVQENGVFPLDFALFRHPPSGNAIVDANTGVAYDNLFDAMVDAVHYSMKALNFTGIPVVVTETGWPWLGGSTEPDATADNAFVFNTNLIRRVSGAASTPAQMNRTMHAYVYELFDSDDLQEGRPSEMHWGLFFRNGTEVYPVDFAGAEGGNATSPGLTNVYCVARPGADPRALEVGLNWACGPGSADCSAVQPGQPCHSSSIASVASYAYNDYYRRARGVGGTCDFGGTALITTFDPSFGSCVFVGSLVSRATNGSCSGGGGGGGSGGGSSSIAPAANGPAGMTSGISKLGFSWARHSIMVLLLVLLA